MAAVPTNCFISNRAQRARMAQKHTKFLKHGEQISMPDSTETTGVATSRIERLRFGDFLHLVGGFWGHPASASPWLLTFGVLAVAVLEIVIQVGINQWNGWFFDILSGKSTGRLSHAALVFCGLAVAAIGAGATGVLCRLLLQVRWRQWLTSEMLEHWLRDSRYLRLVSIGGDGNNPEYRIAEDVRLSTEPVTDFITGLIGAMLTSVAFLGLLWTLGGDIGIPGTAVRVPGYMVFAVLVYSAIGWTLIILVGGSYVGVVKDRNEAEAKLRYELIHLREQSVLRHQVDAPMAQRAIIARALTGVATAWTRVAHRSAQMTWITYGNTIIAPVVPLLLVAPKYLDGGMSLGEMMQVAMAFVQVQAALNWFVSNYGRLAEWYASVVRVVALEDALGDLDSGRGLD